MSTPHRGDLPRAWLFLLVAVALSAAACTSRPVRAPVQILAPDTLVHLGDDRTPPPGWVALFDRRIPSLEWPATFYVPDSRGAWQLSVEVQGGRESTSEIQVNGHLVDPGFSGQPAAIDASWRTITATVPSGTLRPGRNQVLIRTSLHAPYRQSYGDIWDDFQLRHVRLLPAGE